MCAQTKAKLAKMIEQFPAVAVVRNKFKRPSKDGVISNPITNVVVQKSDVEMMHWQANNVSRVGRAYISRMHKDSERRGTRTEVLYAVNEQDEIIATLDWRNYESFEERSKLYLKQIFKEVKSSDVAYLIWAQVYVWFEPTKEESDSVFGDFIDHELTAIVCPKPKSSSWDELTEKAEVVKKERENAYKYNPKQMPELEGIHKALDQGHKLHAFSSGGGLRVVSLHNKKGKGVGYGEHPHVEEALNHCDEDFIAGCRPYGEVYGSNGKYPHYLTGDTLSTSNIDYWIRAGHTFDCWKEGSIIVLVLSGYSELKVPDWVEDKLKKSPTVKWKDRGFVFVATEYTFPRGTKGMSIETLPDVRKDVKHATFYKITKTGKGSTFWNAMISAFEAPEVEVMDS